MGADHWGRVAVEAHRAVVAASVVGQEGDDLSGGALRDGLWVQVERLIGTAAGCRQHRGEAGLR